MTRKNSICAYQTRKSQLRGRGLGTGGVKNSLVETLAYFRGATGILHSDARWAGGTALSSPRE